MEKSDVEQAREGLRLLSQFNDKLKNAQQLDIGDLKKETRKAYLKAALEYHPDKNKSEDAREKFQAIQAFNEMVRDDVRNQEMMAELAKPVPSIQRNAIAGENRHAAALPLQENKLLPEVNKQEATRDLLSLKELAYNLGLSYQENKDTEFVSLNRSLSGNRAYTLQVAKDAVRVDDTQNLNSQEKKQLAREMVLTYIQQSRGLSPEEAIEGKLNPPMNEPVPIYGKDKELQSFLADELKTWGLSVQQQQAFDEGSTMNPEDQMGQQQALDEVGQMDAEGQLSEEEVSRQSVTQDEEQKAKAIEDSEAQRHEQDEELDNEIAVEEVEEEIESERDSQAITPASPGRG